MNIGIFGTGSALRDFLSMLPPQHIIAGLADNNAARHGSNVEGHRIHSPEALVALKPDFIVIAARAADALRAQLIGLGMSPDLIAAYYPSYSQMLGAQVNADIIRINDKLGLGLPLAGIATMYLWPEAQGAAASGVSEDFVRRHAMRLCAERIADRKIAGSIAELGVYQGEQAALLNRLFPDRTLHLFDTFEGFAPADVATEARAGFSQAALGDFQDTSVDLVMAKMAHPEQVQVHAGMFPDTVAGVEDRFAFVSLDVDLYEPTLAGLEYFHPRLTPGGFIFIHDYNNRRYAGVRHAVDAFLDRTQAPAFPLPDFAGSLVVMR